MNKIWAFCKEIGKCRVFVVEFALPMSKIKQVVGATEGRWDYILCCGWIKLPDEIGEISRRGRAHSPPWRHPRGPYAKRVTKIFRLQVFRRVHAGTSMYINEKAMNMYECKRA